MQRLFPDHFDNPDDDALAISYRWPETAGRALVRANMVSSLDGRAALSGKSGGLSNPADQHLLALLRDLADVVLVGAGTVRAEGYPGIRSDADRRARWGFAASPPVAVITNGSLRPDMPLFTDTETRPLVITTATAASTLPNLNATVVIAGRDRVDLAIALSELAANGLRRVLCEGGPSLLAALLAANLVDELCLTSAPLLVGAGAVDLLAGSPLPSDLREQRWHLHTVHRDTDHLFTHYRRVRKT